MIDGENNAWVRFRRTMYVNGERLRCFLLVEVADGDVAGGVLGEQQRALLAICCCVNDVVSC